MPADSTPSAQLLQLLLDAVVQTDALWNITYLNPAWHKLTGHGEQMVSGTISDPELRSLLMAARYLGLSSGPRSPVTLAAWHDSPRFDLAGVPQHVVQRGNNRLPCFLDDGDRSRYLECLAQALMRFDCRLHAYVLMSNHVHLLLTPDARGAVSQLMHTFSRNDVGLFNGRHGRTVRYGKVASSHAWSTRAVTSWHAADT